MSATICKKYAPPHPALLRALSGIDPGHEVAHAKMLRACAGLGTQRTLVREMILVVIFARSEASPWARRAARELKEIVSEA